jgi:hypothetical protein
VIIYRETTDWGDIKCPNHIYVLDDKKENLLAYIKAGTNEHKVFSKPIRFDMRHRTFKELKRTKPADNLIKVEGSKGAVYLVDPETKTCSCPGYKFRGDCKHVAEIQQAA